MLLLHSGCNNRWWANNRSVIIKNVVYLGHDSAVREIQFWTQNAVRFRGYESRITKLNVQSCIRKRLFYLPDKCCVNLGYLLFLQFSLFDDSVLANLVDLSLSTSPPPLFSSPSAQSSWYRLKQNFRTSSPKCHSLSKRKSKVFYNFPAETLRFRDARHTSNGARHQTIQTLVHRSCIRCLKGVSVYLTF